MKASHQQHIIGVPISSAAFLIERSLKGQCLPDPSGQHNLPPPKKGSSTCKQSGVGSALSRINKLGKNADRFTYGVREHVRLAPKITETLKGKLSLGARILRVGGVEKVFKQLFDVREGEKLLKASQCYLSTTAGPIAGLLFISTDKAAFCSEKAIKFSSPSGELNRIYYKVLIPVRKIKRVNQSENVKKPSQKYIDIVTTDNFEFWFMGFIHHQKAFKYISKQSLKLKESPEYSIMLRRSTRYSFCVLVSRFRTLSDGIQVSSTSNLSSLKNHRSILD